MAKWYTVESSKIVWAPIGTRTKKDGTVVPRFSRIGIRIDMEDGTHWFYSFKHDSWTLHHKPVRQLDCLGRPAVFNGKPVFHPAKTSRWANWAAVKKDFGKRSPGIIAALQSGAVAALEAAESES